MTVPGDPLTVTPTDEGFDVHGEIDAHTAPILAAALDGRSDGDVVLDLSGVEFVDSSGLRTLIEAHQQAEERGSTLVIARPSEAVVRLLAISGVDEYLSVRTD